MLSFISFQGNANLKPYEILCFSDWQKLKTDSTGGTDMGQTTGPEPKSFSEKHRAYIKNKQETSVSLLVTRLM